MAGVELYGSLDWSAEVSDTDLVGGFIGTGLARILGFCSGGSNSFRYTWFLVQLGVIGKDKTTGLQEI